MSWEFLLCRHVPRLKIHPLIGITDSEIVIQQIPYTMMKFASFETIVEMIYSYMPGKKSDYGRGTQTAVSFAGGYAGMPKNRGFLSH